jgi:hypothetical protein
MSAIYSITPDKLSRLIGTASCSILVDVRVDEDFEADPHFIPATLLLRRRCPVNRAAG